MSSEKSSNPAMEHFTPTSLNSLPERIEYLKHFIGFGPDDVAALHAAKPVVAPLLPAILDAVYLKLFSFDVTRAAFLPRNTGYTGQVAQKLEELTLDHPQIAMRKDFLKAYFVKVVSADYDDIKTWEYLDRVGLVHTGVQQSVATGKAVKKSPLRVEYMHNGLLLGYVEDIVINAVLTHPDLDDATKLAVTRAFNKILWIQNDLFARHYVKDLSQIDEERVQTREAAFGKPLNEKVVALSVVSSLALVSLAYKFLF